MQGVGPILANAHKYVVSASAEKGENAKVAKPKLRAIDLIFHLPEARRRSKLSQTFGDTRDSLTSSALCRRSLSIPLISEFKPPH